MKDPSSSCLHSLANWSIVSSQASYPIRSSGASEIVRHFAINNAIIKTRANKVHAHWERTFSLHQRPTNFFGVVVLLVLIKCRSLRESIHNVQVLLLTFFKKFLVTSCLLLGVVSNAKDPIAVASICLSKITLIRLFSGLVHYPQTMALGPLCLLQRPFVCSGSDICTKSKSI